MNLLLFPQVASESNGYTMVVKSDYLRLSPIEGKDQIVWYSSSLNNEFFGNKDVVVKRPNRITTSRILNVLRGRPSTEFNSNQLRQFVNRDFESIFCGDTIFYRAARKTFPEHRLKVRFHNCYYRIEERITKLNLQVDLRFSQVLKSFKRLESEIFHDLKTIPIFLSREDQTFFENKTGRNDSFLWEVGVDTSKIKESRNTLDYGCIDTLVYFGGVDTHKKKSIDFFAEEIFPKVKKHLPDIQFKLYGLGTEAYLGESIKGYGRFEGKSFPHCENALYLNPDLTGGGVKIKIKTYLENGVRSLSTPYGFEGYSNELIDQKYCWVSELNQWVDKIPQIVLASRNNTDDEI